MLAKRTRSMEEKEQMGVPRSEGQGELSGLDDGNAKYKGTKKSVKKKRIDKYVHEGRNEVEGCHNKR